MQPTLHLSISGCDKTSTSQQKPSVINQTWLGRQVSQGYQAILKLQNFSSHSPASQEIDNLPAGPYLDGDCKNFLRTELFKPYLEQLKVFLDQYPLLPTHIDQLPSSPFQKSFLKFYQHLNHPPVQYSSGINRIYYTQFLTLLRNCQKEAKAFSSQTDESIILVRNFLDKFIQYYMKEMIFYHHGMDFLYKAGVSKNLAINKPSEIGPVLSQGLKQISHHKNQGMVTGLFDPNLLGNIPYQTFTLESKHGKSITVFRCANLTMDEERVGNNLTKSNAGQQFNLFFDAYSREGKKHLYINLMKRKMPNENESIRSQVIENLEADYPGALNVVSLDRNSSFYFQSYPYLNLNQSNDFKNQFKKHLKNDKFYYWSKNVDVQDLHKEIDAIIEHIHHTYFQSAESLSLDKRQAFIELAYCMIIDTLIAKVEPDSCNFSCKSCIDRGGITNATMYLYYLIKKQRTIKPEQFNYLQYLTLLPALLVGNRQIQSSYFQRLVTFAKVFLNTDQLLPTPLPHNDYIRSINEAKEVPTIFEKQQKISFDEFTQSERRQWRIENFIKRKKLPLLNVEHRNQVESQHLEKLPNIRLLIRKHIDRFDLNLNESKKNEITNLVSAHYILTMQYYAPAIVKWMDSLLQQAEDRKLVFLARDGIVFHDVASILLNRDPKRYPHQLKNLIVAWLSRKSTEDAAQRGGLIERYFKQLGINPDDHILLIDTGCTGTIKNALTLSVKNKLDCQFSVSRNPNIYGFWDNSDFSLQALAFINVPSDHEDSWINDPKTANDWVEDTHRGNFISADKLIEEDGIIFPHPSMEWCKNNDGGSLVIKETPVQNEAELSDFLVREYGRQAILDFAQEVHISDTILDYNEIKLNLNDLLTRIQKKEIAHASCQHD